jgi:tripartite-type tricarboxylate transporter receptor subunit TctC
MTKLIRAFLVLCLVVAVTPPVAAAEYPATPVRILVPFAAGSSTDGLARVVAHELQLALGGSFIVENRAGASGMLAAEQVRRAEPDGHTLFVTTHTTQAANPSLFKTLPYDPIKDFTAISRLTAGQFVLVVHPSIPARSVDELVALARAQPGKLSYATSNSTSLVAAEWLKALRGLDIVGISYKSNPSAMTDLVAGRVPLMFADQANAVPLIKSSKLRALAVTGQTRSQLVPDVPTMEQAGIAGFALNSWAALYGPAGMPHPIVDKLHAAIAAALKKPDVLEKLTVGFGYEVIGSTPAELTDFNREEVDRWRRAITAAKIEPQ